MKKIFLIGFLALMIYATYILFIIAPLIRIPFIKNNDFLLDTIVNPEFQIIKLLPFVIVYSAIKYKDYYNIGLMKNVIRHIFFYLILYNSSYLFGKKGIENYVTYSSVILIGMLGSALYLIFHVSFFNYLLRTKKLSQLLGKL